MSAVRTTARADGPERNRHTEPNRVRRRICQPYDENRS